MEIKIDTNKDSKEHIQHMIEFLQRFVTVTQSGAVQSEPVVNEGMFGMFGENQPAPEPEQQPDTLQLEPY